MQDTNHAGISPSRKDARAATSPRRTQNTLLDALIPHYITTELTVSENGCRTITHPLTSPTYTPKTYRAKAQSQCHRFFHPTLLCMQLPESKTALASTTGTVVYCYGPPQVASECVVPVSPKDFERAPPKSAALRVEN
jgi:hypothetical protein